MKLPDVGSQNTGIGELMYVYGYYLTGSESTRPSRYFWIVAAS